MLAQHKSNIDLLDTFSLLLILHMMQCRIVFRYSVEASEGSLTRDQIISFSSNRLYVARWFITLSLHLCLLLTHALSLLWPLQVSFITIRVTWTTHHHVCPQVLDHQPQSMTGSSSISQCLGHVSYINMTLRQRGLVFSAIKP